MRSLLARLRRVRLLEPLAERDFALLTAGAFISLLGDGFFYVALAWQVYEISNVPTALSLVGLAWTLPLLFFVLIGGVFSDPIRPPLAADWRRSDSRRGDWAARSVVRDWRP